MRGIAGALTVLWLAAAVMAQDNPIPQVGTVGGSNLRTNNASVPYIFGDGSGMYVKARVDLASLGLRRPLSDLGIVFNADGSFYFNTITSSYGPAPNSGVTKFNADGTLGWTNTVPQGTGGGQAGTEPIVGSNYVYSQRLGSASSAIYALDKGNGSVVWQRDLSSQVSMSPVLSDGYLYGVESNNMAFVVNASTGALVYEQPMTGIATQSYSRPTFIENCFGPGLNGMFWKASADTGTCGISISADPFVGAVKKWSQPYSGGGLWNYNDMYDPTTKQIYRRMGDSADTGVQGIDPNTGNILWRWTGPSQGYEGCAVVSDPSRPGFITSGQGNTIYRIDVTKTYTDPNDGLVKLDPNTCYVWTKAAQADWPTTNRTIMVTDPATGQEVCIFGTDGALGYNHRIMGVDPDTGATIFEFQDPNDPAPDLYSYGGALWRNLSISPNGDLVFLMCDPFSGSYPDHNEYGINGTLMIVSEIPEPASLALLALSALAVMRRSPGRALLRSSGPVPRR